MDSSGSRICNFTTIGVNCEVVDIILTGKTNCRTTLLRQSTDSSISSIASQLVEYLSKDNRTDAFSLM